MRGLITISLFWWALATSAFAADLHVLTPPVIDNAGLKELAADFTAQTGTKVIISVTEMLKVADNARTQPTDVVFLEPALLQALIDKGGAVGPATPLGRVNIGLAVSAGAPHPDISTVPQLAAALRGAKVGVAYSNPDPARGSMVAKMVDTMLKRDEFRGVHGVIVTQGNGISGLMRGEGDMALQFETEILPHKEVELVGPLPAELKEYVDIGVAVSASAVDRQTALSFITFLKSPKALAVWKARGLDPL